MLTFVGGYDGGKVPGAAPLFHLHPPFCQCGTSQPPLPASLEDIASISASFFRAGLFLWQLWDWKMSGSGRRGWSETSGWWCVSLTSPSVLPDRTILATPIQGCWLVRFISGAARVSDSSTNCLSFCSSSSPPQFFFSLPLFCSGSRLSLRMHSLILACFGTVSCPVFWKGGEAWQRFTWRRWRREVHSFLCKNTDYAEIYRSGLLWTRLVLWRMLGR